MPQNQFLVAAQYQPLMRELGIDAQSIFEHPDVHVWRKIPERENGTLDADVDGKPIRLHVKRYAAASRGQTPAAVEAEGHGLLIKADIPTAVLIAHGRLADGRSFFITQDLAGYRAADKVLADAALPFSSFLKSTAEITARLHNGGLHHRDLYLCHFFVRSDAQNPDPHVIDAARVSKLPAWPFRHRWIVKDLAQFWYSTLSLPITDDDRHQWVSLYAQARNVSNVARLLRQIQRKSNSIARHDERLRRTQPTRNVSIPGA